MKKLLTLQRPTLGWSFVIVLSVLVLGIFTFAHIDSVRAARANARAVARNDAVLDAERLASVAQRQLSEHPAEVASELAMLATRRRLQALAVITPQGDVALAHRIAWQGKPAHAVIAGFNVAAFRRAAAGRLPEVIEREGPPRIVAMIPYLAAADAQGAVAANRGVVYLEYDLSLDDELAQWRAGQRLAPLALVTMVVIALLLWAARRYVTQPMARMERASLELADFNRFPAPLPESGLREVAGLARGLNEMSRRIESTQQALASSGARLAGIFQAAMDAIITVDAAHRVTVINPAALAMFRCTEAQVLGQPVDVLIPSRFQPHHGQYMDEFMHSGQTSRSMGAASVVAARRMDGEEFPVEASISHLVLDGEHLLTVILRDVTERKRAEEAVLDLNNRLEEQVAQRTARLQETTRTLEEQQQVLTAANVELSTIFDTVPVGIVLLHHRVILRCNRRLEEILGYGRGELDGQSTRLWYPDDHAFVVGGQAPYEELARQHFHQREQEMVRRDGARFWCRMRFRPLGEGEDPVLLGVLEDLTLQHDAQQSILLGKQRAEEASQAKSAFLANMSHEIRTPMNAIIGLSYLMLKGELQPRQRDQLQKIQASSQHLLGIINDILDYSKIEAGKLGLEQIAFRLDSVLDHVTGLFAEKAAAKGLELLVEVDPQVPQNLIGDPLRLGQILINYANNAVKFTEHGQVVVRLSARERVGDDLVLYGEVSDTGIGLSAPQIDRLFHSFHQSDNSITREFGGTGLGLAICKQLSSLMQGDVGVRSTLGVGSTFWFTARVKVGDARQLSEPSGNAHVPWGASGLGALDDGGRAPLRLAGARVLVVEDDELNREVAQEILEGAGLLVELAVNGQDALDRIASNNYDVVLMDMQMPVMDGIAATRELRSHTRTAALPIVAMTANAMEVDRQACLDAGMNDFVSKPMGPAALFAVLQRWIGARDGVGVALSSVTPTAADETLPVIDGLDCEAGLRRVLGKRGFYLSMLRKFAQRQSGAVVLVRQALAQSDRVSAERQLHTLKGLAGSIGMVPLQHAAAQAERLVREGGSDQALATTLQDLHGLLEGFVQQLDAQLPDEAAGFAPDSVDHGAVQAICQRLAGLLVEDDLEAGDVLTDNGALLRGAFGAAFESIDAAVRRFDCEAALLHLREACRARGYDLVVGAAP